MKAMSGWGWCLGGAQFAAKSEAREELIEELLIKSV